MNAKRLNKSVEEYFLASGWSSHLFVDHARLVFAKFPNVLVGRSVIHIINEGKLIKVYVHHAGKTKEFMTITDAKGIEIASFHYTIPPETVLQKITELLT